VNFTNNFPLKILIADSDIHICHIVTTKLFHSGYNVLTAANGKEALLLFQTEQPDLVILDLMLPKISGYQVCRKIRNFSTIPIIILTALNDITNRLISLDLGADDYITKPFISNELQARIQVILRRVHKPTYSYSSQIQIGTLKIDFNRKCVIKNNIPIRLTIIELNLLQFLINKRGEQLTRASILNHIWGYTPERASDARVVDVYISRLRIKIEKNARNPNLIKTIRGIGYMFQNVHT
jgi:OmpR family response regulator RpaB